MLGAPIRRTRFAVVLSIVLVLGLTIAACTSGSETTSSPPTKTDEATSTPNEPTALPTATPTPTPTPDRRDTIADTEFREDDCDFVVPAETEPTCGWVEVPQSTGADFALSLPVAVFPATGDQPVDDPVVFLHGGPGFGILAELDLLWASKFAALNEDRDVVIFDQRESGLATISKPCPVLLRIQLLDRDVVTSYYTKVLAKCTDESRALGLDPTAYGADAMAADLAHIAGALNYDKINLYGTSHGGRIAQSVLAHYPHLVRSTVMDSPLSFETDLISSMPASFEQAIANLGATCQRSPECEATFTDLTKVIKEEIAATADAPIEVNIWERRGFVPISLGPTAFSSFIFERFYDEVSVASLPAVFAELASGDSTLLERLVNEHGVYAPEVTPQFTWTMCVDEVPLSSEYRVAQSLTHSTLDLVTEPPDGRGISGFDVCDQLDIKVPTPTPLEIDTDSPVLVLAGAYDPITPVADSKALAESLPRAYYAEFPDLSHGVGLDWCASQIIQNFIKAPTTPPSTLCLANRTHLDVQIPPPDRPLEPELETTVFHTATRQHEVLAPQGWRQTWIAGSTLLLRDLTPKDNTLIAFLDLSGEGDEATQLAAGLDDLGTPILDEWNAELVLDETPCCDWEATAATTHFALQLAILTSSERQMALVLAAYPDELPALIESILIPASSSIVELDQ